MGHRRCSSQPAPRTSGRDWIYQTAVNVQAFTTTFTFVPNGQNCRFFFQIIPTVLPVGLVAAFSSGAGCGGGVLPRFLDERSAG